MSKIENLKLQLISPEQHRKMKAVKTKYSDLSIGDIYQWTGIKSNQYGQDYVYRGEKLKVSSICKDKDELICKARGNDFYFKKTDFFRNTIPYKKDIREVIEKTIEVVKEVPFEVIVEKEVIQEVQVLVGYYDETFWDAIYRWYCKRKGRKVESDLV